MGLKCGFENAEDPEKKDDVGNSSRKKRGAYEVSVVKYRNEGKEEEEQHHAILVEDMDTGHTTKHHLIITRLNPLLYAHVTIPNYDLSKARTPNDKFLQGYIFPKERVDQFNGVVATAPMPDVENKENCQDWVKLVIERANAMGLLISPNLIFP